jgi:hypothetical protein
MACPSGVARPGAAPAVIYSWHGRMRGPVRPGRRRFAVAVAVRWAQLWVIRRPRPRQEHHVGLDLGTDLGRDQRPMVTGGTRPAPRLRPLPALPAAARAAPRGGAE